MEVRITEGHVDVVVTYRIGSPKTQVQFSAEPVCFIRNLLNVIQEVEHPIVYVLLLVS